jgi:hypothetical protein
VAEPPTEVGPSPGPGVDQLAPTTVDLSRLPTAHSAPPGPPKPGRADGGADTPRASSLVLALGVLCLGVFVALNVGEGGTKSAAVTPPSQPTPITPAETLPPASQSQTAPAPAPVTTPHHTKPPHTPPPPHHSVLLTINQSYSLDSLPLSTETNNGFSVIAAWHGSGTPSRADCIESVGSEGTDHVVLEGSGVPVGGWICAKTIAGHVLRFRYEGGNPNSGYRFLLTIYPG